MKKLFCTALLVNWLLVSPAWADMHIFACEPEWAALAKEIGGAHVTVYTATTAHQDAHNRTLSPSWLREIQQAELVLCTGAGLESSWLPRLLEKTGKKGLYAADFVPLIPSAHTRHRQGNPHIHLDPHNILAVAKALTGELARGDKANRRIYEKGYADFAARWERAISNWERKAEPLKGMKVVVRHDAWPYVLRWLGIKQVAMLEPFHDVPPSAAHLASIINTVKTERPTAIILAPFEETRTAEWLRDKYPGLKIIVLPFTVGEETPNLESLFDRIIPLLLSS